MVLGVLGSLGELLGPPGWLLEPSWPTWAPRANITSKKLIRGPLWDPPLGAILGSKLANLAQSELTKCLLEDKLAKVGHMLAEDGSSWLQGVRSRLQDGPLAHQKYSRSVILS